MSRIYLSPPDVGADERALILDAFDSNWIAPLGPHVDAFEAEMAAFVGVETAVALASGTAGLHLALALVGVGPGDDVIVPSLTFAATAFAAVYLGARPCFVDSETASWNLDPELLDRELADRAARGRRPAAVVSVDLYGQCADYDRIVATCAHHEVPLVEDAAEALGATYHGRAAGTFGDVGVFSFNGNKIITTSGGGMLVARDPRLVARARHLSQQARDPALHYQHSEIGYAYRMSNLLAALGRGQLRGLPAKIARRAEIFARYHAALADVPGLRMMPIAESGTPNWWLTVVTLGPECGTTPAEVCAHLEGHDIEARPAWKPLHLQPVFASAPMRGGRVAETVFAQGLCLPSGSAMTDADVDRVAAAVRGVVAP
ncbi:MAG: DegT/DnrJ/EryC1/StrS family aminotransferase [Actinomycetota bacterium]